LQPQALKEIQEILDRDKVSACTIDMNIVDATNRISYVERWRRIKMEEQVKGKVQFEDGGKQTSTQTQTMATEDLERIVFEGEAGSETRLSEMDQKIQELKHIQDVERRKLLSDYSGIMYNIFAFLDKSGIYHAEKLVVRETNRIRRMNNTAKTMINEANRSIDNYLGEMQRSEDVKIKAGILAERYEVIIDEMGKEQGTLTARYQQERQEAVKNKEDLSYQNTMNELREIEKDIKEYRRKLEKAAQRFCTENRVIALYNRQIAKLENRKGLIEDEQNGLEETLRMAQVSLAKGVSAIDVVKLIRNSEYIRTRVGRKNEVITEMEKGATGILIGLPKPETDYRGDDNETDKIIHANQTRKEGYIDRMKKIMESDIKAA